MTPGMLIAILILIGLVLIGLACGCCRNSGRRRLYAASR